MTDRHAEIKNFLATTPWADARVELLAADASFRVYHRLTGAAGPAVLMDAPPGKEDVRPFAMLADHLVALGYSAPRVLARDERAGFLLLEDLGDATITRLLRDGADEQTLYDLATDLLIDLHQRSADQTVPEGLAPYDSDALMAEALLFTDWFLPQASGVPTPDAVRADYIAAWQPLFDKVQSGPKTLVLRDYHVDNIMRLDGRDGLAALGLLDFQDALVGHPAYDLMSLLEDARRDIPQSLIARQKARYQDAMGAGDAFDEAFAILGAGRHAKVIGIFTRLMARDGKPAYLGHIPRCWRLLEGSLDHPSLASVRLWMETHVPGQLRTTPPFDNI